MKADPGEAAREVVAGRPGPEARVWLARIMVVVFGLFVLNTFGVARNQLLPFDLPVAHFLQVFPFGPLVYPMELINWLGGYKQIALGVIAVVALAMLDRRAGWLMAIGGVSSLLDNLIKLGMARQRPTANLVHIFTPAPGFSYPSGHAVFFTWLSFMLAVAVAPRMPARLRPIPWLLAVAVSLLACVARVWAGDHWPSDVLGGFLLGLGWSAFVLWLPERFLPAPSVNSFRRRLRWHPSERRNAERGRPEVRR